MWNIECGMWEGQFMSHGDKIGSFTDLQAWQEGHKLVLEIYKITNDFPSEEKFGLNSQLRRAVVSVTSNIAEGFRRISYKEKARFYSMASASLSEVQNQLIIARDVGYITNNIFQELAEKTITVNKLTYGLVRSSQKRS